MANRYWVGDSGEWNGTSTTHWSASSGGVNGASVPTINDDVFFDSNSFSIPSQTVTIKMVGGIICVAQNLDFSGVTNDPFILLFSGMGVLNLKNNLTLSNSMTFSSTTAEQPGNLYFVTPGTTSLITSNGCILNDIVLTIYSTTDVSLGDDFSMTGVSTFQVGEDVSIFSTQNFNMNVINFVIAGHINLGSSTIDVFGGSIVFYGTPEYFDAGTSIINIYVSATTWFDVPDYSPSTFIFNELNIIDYGGLYIIFGDIHNNANTRGNITANILSFGSTKVIFCHGSTYTANSLLTVLRGMSSPIDFVSNDPGNYYTISAGSTNINYLTVTDAIATGVGAPFYNINGVDGGNNVDWIFVLSPTLTSLTPSHGIQNGGTVVIIIGTNFEIGNTSVTIGGNTISSTNVAVNGAQTEAVFTTPYHVVGNVDVTVTTIVGGTSNALTFTYTPVQNFTQQNVFLAFADKNGDVQNLNIGTADNNDPIYYELETQEIDFGNRAHLKKISDKIVIFSKEATDSILQASQNGEYKPVPMTLDRRVNIGEDISLEGHYFTFKWSGKTTTNQPVFEGILLEDIEDKGITYA